MILVNDIVKRFEGNTVLNHVSADIRDGQVNMIIGQSGSGKTVLMKSLIGLHRPDSGDIRYGNPNIENQPMQSLSAMDETQLRALRREMGMLFQGSALFDSMNVIDNVRFPLDMFSTMSEDEKQARARYCLEHVNLPQHVYRLMPGEISGGQQKRVAIARAIVLKPKYLFCDEPNSGLDPVTSLVIDKLIHDITVELNICTIINSHDMNSIMEIGDNIIFLNSGVKEWQGSKDDILHADNEALNRFVFASRLAQSAKKNMQS